MEHGHHAAFDRKAFLAVGGYDESFTHNEDAELDIRLRKSGAKIWLCSELGIAYFPRDLSCRPGTPIFQSWFRTREDNVQASAPSQSQAIASIGRAFGVNMLSLASGIGFGWPFFPAELSLRGSVPDRGMFLALSERDPAGWAGGLAAIIMHQSWAAGFIFRAFRA